MSTSFVDKVAASPEPPARSGIRDRLNVELPGSDKFVKILLHADSGVGKTFFCGTAGAHEETGPVLIIDCEGGTDTVRGWPNVEKKTVRSMGELKKVFDDIANHNDGWYKTFALDSLSEIQDVDMRAVMIDAKQTAKNPEMVNLDVPSPREWGIGRNHVRTITRAFRDLEANVIVTTLTNTIQKEGKPDRMVPALPGKLGYEIPGFMGIVGWYHFDDNKQIERVMQLKGTNRVMAKTRFKELGDLLKDPTMPMIWDMLYNPTNTEDNTDANA